jgi:hypothetical protein
VMFRHVQKNIEEWSSLKDIPDRSLRGVARIIGIILWDWTVSGDAKNESASTLYVARDIGKQAAACADRGGWDQEATLTKSQIEDLKTSLRSILENPWRKRSPPLAALGKTKQVLLASDAMNLKGAGILLETGRSRVIWEKNWNPQESIQHINWKEIAAAISTVETALELNGDQFDIIIAVDNTMAEYCLNHFYHAYDPEMTTRLGTLLRELRRREVGLKAIYIPGTEMPADEPSRGLEIDQEKALRCREKMETEVSRLRKRSRED